MGASFPLADSHDHQIGRPPVADFVSTKVGVSLLRTPTGVSLLPTLMTSEFRFFMLPTLVGLSFLVILCNRRSGSLLGSDSHGSLPFPDYADHRSGSLPFADSRDHQSGWFSCYLLSWPPKCESPLILLTPPLLLLNPVGVIFRNILELQDENRVGMAYIPEPSTWF